MKSWIRFFLLFILSVGLPISFAEAPIPTPVLFILEEATISSVQNAIKAGKITCEQLVSTYIERIKKYNIGDVSNKPPINSITELNPFAIDAARKLDQAFLKTRQFAGPFHCVPVIIKDNIDSYDSTSTSGSLALLGSQPVKDAFLVAQLRQAGAILLAKGSMDEFANGLSGISSRSGRTGNAYDPWQNSGGSSGGPASALSANFALVSIGSDNSGSVRIPAAFNGVFGLRPSTGLISQRGIFPRGNIDGVAGPMARTVEDLARVLDVIAKQDNQDKKTQNIARPQSYLVFLKENGLQGKRIGLVSRVGKYDIYKDVPENVREEIEKSLQRMQELGATIIPNIDLLKFDSSRDLNEAGEAQDINEYLASFPSTRKNYRDICESDRTRSFGTVDECLEFVKALPRRDSNEYAQITEIIAKNKKYVEDMMAKYKLDALLMPISKTGTATYEAEKVNTWKAPIASNAGLPAITINFGYINGMPLGVELIGKQFAEGTLIEIAYAYEKHTSPRAIPYLSDPIHIQFSIAEVNNLITQLGNNAYQYVLKNGASKDLTPENFRRIATNTFSSLKAQDQNAQGNPSS